MTPTKAATPRAGLPLTPQIMGLLLGGLVVAQLVTLVLTLLIPPEPPPQYELGDIARVLEGAADRARNGRPLQRLVQATAPEPAGPGWLTSENSRHDLAALLGRGDGDVRLHFFTPLPFAGTARTVPRDESELAPDKRLLRRIVDDGPPPPAGGWLRIDYQMAQAGRGPAGPVGPSGGGLPNGWPGGVPDPAVPAPGVGGAWGTGPGAGWGPWQGAGPGPGQGGQAPSPPAGPTSPSVGPTQSLPSTSSTPLSPAQPGRTLTLMPPGAGSGSPNDAWRGAGPGALYGTGTPAPTAPGGTDGPARLAPPQPAAPARPTMAGEGPAPGTTAGGRTADRLNTVPTQDNAAQATTGTGGTQRAQPQAARVSPAAEGTTSSATGTGTGTAGTGSSTAPAGASAGTGTTGPAGTSAGVGATGVGVPGGTAARSLPAQGSARPAAAAIAEPLSPGGEVGSPDIDSSRGAVAAPAVPARPGTATPAGDRTPGQGALTAAPSVPGQVPAFPARPLTTSPAGVAAPAGPAAALPAPSDTAASRPPARPAPAPQTVPAPQPARGLFGIDLGPAPFVEGDFVAALRLADGRWAVAQPMPEAFPNAWQRRVLLWFALAAALVAPLGWLFSRRLVRPLDAFARAAERLGRDPTGPVLAPEGPAEVGRAAHAFNRMQDRVRSLIGDRTAMIGAISHDLRTPLTRMRFRIEDAPDALRDGMLRDVKEMEQMIASVLAFLHDASEPGKRERLDLSAIVEGVVADAALVGKPVTLQAAESAPVEVDAVGMRRLFGNLVENAVKYGERAQVRLFTDRREAVAVAEVSDDGPGLPEDELERVFRPFYRTPAARASAQPGTGLGLAVCRSIARAHGGDVRLLKGEGRAGLVAQVRVPLAYGAAHA